MTRPSVSLRLVPGVAAAPRPADAALPARVKLLHWGRNESIYGPVILDETSAASFAANQRQIGRERLPLDFEHNTVEGTPEYLRTQEPRAIAAQGSPVLISGDGLYLENLTWTATGTQSARDFEDLSPSVFLDPAGRVIGLHSAALTRTGAVHGLTLFTAAHELGAMLQTLSAAVSAAGISNTKPNMPEQTTGTAPELAALTARIDELAGLVKLLQTPDLTAVLQPLSARIELLEARKATDAQATADAQRAGLVAEASRAGKVIPLSAASLALLPLPLLTEMLAALPAGSVPLSASARPGADASPSTFAARVAELVQAGKSKGAAVQTAISADPASYRAWRQEGGSL